MNSCLGRDLMGVRPERISEIVSLKIRFILRNQMYQRVGPWRQQISSTKLCRENLPIGSV
jgi:hypothetical protein